MKSLTLRSSVALACALSLAACGGSGGNLSLAGAIYGLTKEGLVLQNKGGDPLTIAAGQTSFVFPKLLGSDEDFEVTIKSAPASAKCQVINGKGKTGAFNITSVIVSCETNKYPLGGSFTGVVDPVGLVLVNDNDRQQITTKQSSFAMNEVPDGSPYSVGILESSLAGRKCTVANGTGTMGAGPVTNIQVNCI